MYGQAAELPGLHRSGKSVWAVRSVCGGWRPPRPPHHPQASVSVPHSSRYTRGSKDEKQLGFIAAKTDHKLCTSSPA